MKKRSLFLVLMVLILNTIFSPLSSSVRASNSQDSSIKIIGLVPLKNDRIQKDILNQDEIKRIKKELVTLAESEDYIIAHSDSIRDSLILQAIKNPFTITRLFDFERSKREKHINLVKGLFSKTYLAISFNSKKNALEILAIKKAQLEYTSIPIILLLALVLVIFKKIFSILSETPKGYVWKRDILNINIFSTISIILAIIFVRLGLFASSYQGLERLDVQIFLGLCFLGMVDNIAPFKNKWQTTIITILLSAGLMYALFFF